VAVEVLVVEVQVHWEYTEVLRLQTQVLVVAALVEVSQQWTLAEVVVQELSL
jgi:hypothetical protein